LTHGEKYDNLGKVKRKEKQVSPDRAASSFCLLKRQKITVFKIHLNGYEALKQALPKVIAK
jgi:hypothetical protein